MIDMNEKLQRLILCFIDFEDPKSLFSFEQFSELLDIGARPVNLPEREP